jgi:hypothetical protein
MRFLTAFVGTAALVLLTAQGALAQARPDFSGTWTLDPASAPAARSKGVSPPPQLTLTQDANTLTMSWTQEVSGRTTTETLNLDGSESKTRMGSVQKATWEANRIVVVIRQNLGGNEIEQRRVFSMDGGNLVIELARPDVPGGDPTVVRVVYKKG